jgi:hypothetical protein
VNTHRATSKLTVSRRVGRARGVGAIVRACCVTTLLATAGCLQQQVDSASIDTDAAASRSPELNPDAGAPAGDAMPMDSPDAMTVAADAVPTLQEHAPITSNPQALQADDAGSHEAPPAPKTPTSRPEQVGAQDAGTTDATTKHPQQPPVTLPALPAPSAGACAFEAAAAAPPVNEANPHCPDGIFHGDLQLTNAADLDTLRGCTRVTGNVTVTLEHLSSPAGLQSLRVIEGDLSFSEESCDASGCWDDNLQLTSLRGFENLRCVGGDLRIEQTATYGDQQPLDLSALNQLVEIGGSLMLRLLPGGNANQFGSLRRVWGDVWDAESFTPPWRASTAA